MRVPCELPGGCLARADQYCPWGRLRNDDVVAVEEILAQTRDAACDSGISTRTYKYRVILITVVSSVERVRTVSGGES